MCRTWRKSSKDDGRVPLQQLGEARRQTAKWRLWGLCLLFALALTVSLFASAPGQAQSSVDADLSAWEATAQTAERIIDTEFATDDRLEALRSNLVAYRSAAREDLEPLRERVAALTSQLEAIGPAPTDGAPSRPRSPICGRN